VIRMSGRRGTNARAFAAVTTAFLAVGLAACGGQSGGSAPAAKTVTASPAASHAHAAPSSTAASGSQADGSDGTTAAASASTTGNLPDYQPSHVVSKVLGATVLVSPDSVTKIGAFYGKALRQAGWHITSSSTGTYHASFTAHRGHEGVSISVYPRAGGSGISISRHPE
jgi:hypothetical protein